MANPITWRNVGMPNFGSSNQLQIAAGDQLNAGIAQLGRAADTYRQGQIDAERQTKEFNTQNFLKQINGFNDIDGYDQFNQRINSELGGLNASQVDAAAVQSALQGRDNALRTDALQQQEFSDNQAEVAGRPDTRNANALIAAGEFDEAESVINGSSTITDKSTLLNTLKKARVDAREDKFKMDERTRTLDLRAQTDTALGIRNNALQNVDDPTNLEDYVQGQLQEAGVTDAQIIKNTIAGLQDDFNARNGLTEDQRKSLANAQSVHNSIIDSTNQKIDIMSGSTPTYGDELGHFLDTNNTTSSALKYVAEQSDKNVSWYEGIDGLDHFLTGGDSRWGGDATKMASNALNTAKENLLADKGLESIITGPDGDRMLGAAVKYAMDSVANNDGSGWSQEEFQKQIEKGFKLYHARYTSIKEHEKKLSELVLKRDTLQNDADESLRILENSFKRARRQGQ
ncbi:hypothetical protein ALT721_800080 [Alteromonas alvinellae]